MQKENKAMFYTIAHTSNHFQVFTASLFIAASLFLLAPSLHGQQWCGVSSPDSFAAYEAEHVAAAPSSPIVSTVSDDLKIHVVYFVPRDRANRINKVRRQIQRSVEETLQFFHDERARLGFGTKDLEAARTDEGVIEVQEVIGQKNHAYYEADGWGFSWQRDIGPKWNSFRSSIVLVFADKDTRDLGAPGVRGKGTKSDPAGGFGIFSVSSGYVPYWQVVAHEVGHALGLHHNFNSPLFIMSYGRYQDQLSHVHGKFLDKSPYFNHSPSLFRGKLPVVKPVDRHRFTYDARTDKTQLDFIVNDRDGIWQILFLTETGPEQPKTSASRGAPEVYWNNKGGEIAGQQEVLFSVDFHADAPSDEPLSIEKGGDGINDR